MPRITLRYFAVLRELRGTDSETREVDEGTHVQALYAELFPNCARDGLRVGFAVNAQVVPPTHPLQEGDELALLPPLGGG